MYPQIGKIALQGDNHFSLLIKIQCLFNDTAQTHRARHYELSQPTFARRVVIICTRLEAGSASGHLTPR